MSLTRGLPGRGLFHTGLRRFRLLRLRDSGLGWAVPGWLFRDLWLGGIDLIRANVQFFVCHSIPPDFLIFGVLHKFLPENFIPVFLIFTSSGLPHPRKRRPVICPDGVPRNVIDFIFRFSLIYQGL